MIRISSYSFSGPDVVALANWQTEVTNVSTRNECYESSGGAGAP